MHSSDFNGLWQCANPYFVGGELGGLTTALALSRRGIGERVLESAPRFGAIGYGIRFGPNIFHVFLRLGLMERVLSVADSPVAVLMRDALDGKELVRIPTGAPLRARFRYLNIVFTESICITCCSKPAAAAMRSSSCPMSTGRSMPCQKLAAVFSRRLGAGTAAHWRVAGDGPYNDRPQPGDGLQLAKRRAVNAALSNFGIIQALPRIARADGRPACCLKA